jgi:hypothetical protein
LSTRPFSTYLKAAFNGAFLLDLNFHCTFLQEARTIFRGASSTTSLNLNSCNKDEFNCNDGFCFSLDTRCDGGADCKPGGEDEKGCNLIQLTDDYVKEIPSLCQNP